MKPSNKPVFTMDSERPKPPIFSEHLPTDSQEFLEFSQERQEGFEIASRPFGLYQVTGIKGYRAELKKREQEKRTSAHSQEITQNLVNKRLLSFKNELDDLGEHNPSGYLEFLRGALDEPEVLGFVKESDLAHEMETTLKGMEINTPTEKLYTLYLLKKIPNDILEIMAVRHVEQFEREEKEFNERLPEIIAKFKEQTKKAIDEGVLPLTMDEVDKRLAAMSIRLVDRVSNVFEEPLGSHYANARTIVIGSGIKPEMQEHAIFHELTHALSGRTIIKQTKRDSEESSVDHQRVGLTFYSTKSGEEKKPKIFRWLNEAVTEEIAIQLHGELGLIYRKERHALQKLYAKGVPRELVYKAYFENYDSNNTDRVTAWKELTKKLNELFPNGGIAELQRIDQTFEKSTNSH
jgi:hypothetical protein